MVEKVVAARLHEHMSKHHLHEVMQSAYKPHHCVETALLRVQNDVLAALDDNQGVILALLDLSAAFDLVDHDLLLTRLQQRIGVTGSALAWFQSYLSDRHQVVNIHNTSSTKVKLCFGVPQGSVLGPVLFTIYTLPIGDIARKFQICIHIYADDTQLYVTFDVKGNPATAIQRLEECIMCIKVWMERNKLKLNDGKTEVIFFKPAHLKTHLQLPTVNVGLNPITPAPAVRNLGSTFDEHMTMEQGIKQICASAYFHLRNIAAIRTSLTEEATTQLVHSFVTSRLDGGNSLLFGLPDCAIKKLQRVQNQAARLIKRKSKYDRASPLLKALHWLPVRQRIHFKIALLTFKCRHGMAPEYLSELLQEYHPARSLRSASASLLVVPKTRIKLGERSFAVAAPRVWNDLPLYLRLTDSPSAFKSGLKTHLFKIAFEC